MKRKCVEVNGLKKLKHRYVMEKHLGRRLSEFEIVHHVDGDPSNNDIENLRIMSREEHNRHHHQMRKFR